MATHFDARTGTAVAFGALVTAAAVGLAYCDFAPPEDLPSSAEAIVTHTPEVAWPPPAGDLDAALVATAIRRISESAIYDAGVDAGDEDAGPPIALPEGELDGLQVRRGIYEDIHFLEVVIGPASFEDALPIVYVFHGRGGSATLPGGPFLGLSHPIRVIIPQAPDRLGAGWEWLPVSVGSGLVDRLSSSLFQVSSRLARMIRDLTSERPTIGKPIVSGFSQGGLITYALALHHDDVVGYAFPLSTWLPPPLEPLYRREDLRFPPIRSMHGAADAVIPLGPTRVLVDRLRSRGFDIELVEFEGVGHEMSEAMNELFHRWLERAVCDVVGDADCPGAIDPDAVATTEGGGEEAAECAPSDDPMAEGPLAEGDRDVGPVEGSAGEAVTGEAVAGEAAVGGGSVASRPGPEEGITSDAIVTDGIAPETAPGERAAGAPRPTNAGFRPPRHRFRIPGDGR